MGRRPAVTEDDSRDVLKLSAGAWFADTELSHCSPAARGVWIDLLLRMQRAGATGELSGSLMELALLARTTPEQLAEQLAELRRKGVAEIVGRIVRNGVLVVRNRRMARAAKDREGARERKRASRACDEEGEPIRLAVLRRDRHTCGYCDAKNVNSVDHVTALSRGGEHHPGNMVACCRKCNLRKGNRTLEEAGMTLLPWAVTAMSRERSALGHSAGHSAVPPNVTLPHDSPPPSLVPPAPQRDIAVTGGTWPSLLSLLAARLDPEDLATWLRPLRVSIDEPARLVLRAPTLEFAAGVEELRPELAAAAEKLRPGLVVTIVAASSERERR